jgi:hypothetical protein
MRIRMLTISVWAWCALGVYAQDAESADSNTPAAPAAPQFVGWWGVPESPRRGPSYCDDYAPVIFNGSISCTEYGVTSTDQGSPTSYTFVVGTANNCSQPVSIEVSGNGSANILSATGTNTINGGVSWGYSAWVDPSGDSDASPPTSLPC